MQKSIAAFLCAGLLTAIALTGPVLAEESTFKITDYIPERFADFEWKIGGGAGLTGQDDDNETYDSPTDWFISNVQHRENSRGNLSLNSILRYDHETVPQYLNLELGLRGYVQTWNEEQSDYTTLSSYPGTGRSTYSKSDREIYRVDLRPSVDAGKYLKRDFFISAAVSGYLSDQESPDDERYRHADELEFYDPIIRHSVYDETSESSSHDRELAVAVSFLPGWGRLYEGSYASTAMYMIEELRKNGALLREPTNDDMLELCDLVYKNRLKHAVDDRLRRIETFDEILGFLADAGIADIAGSRGYLFVQDVWDYFPRDRRQFGLRSRLGLGYEYDYFHDERSADYHKRTLIEEYDPASPTVLDTVYNQDEDSHSYYARELELSSLYLMGIVEYGRPLLRRWQLNIDGAVQYYLDRQMTETDVRKSETKNSYKFAVSPALAYIHSSRTRLDFTASYDYRMLKTETIEYDDGEASGPTTSAEADRHNLSIKSTLTYRIAIPTSLSVTAGYEYDSPSTYYYDIYDDFVLVLDSDSGNSHKYTFGVTIEHYLY